MCVMCLREVRRCWRNTLERRGVSFALAGVARAGGVQLSLWYVGSDRGKDTVQAWLHLVRSCETQKAHTRRCPDPSSVHVLHLKWMTGFFVPCRRFRRFSLSCLSRTTNERQRAILIVGGFLRRLPGDFFVNCRGNSSSFAGGFLRSLSRDFFPHFVGNSRRISSFFAGEFLRRLPHRRRSNERCGRLSTEFCLSFTLYFYVQV